MPRLFGYDGYISRTKMYWGIVLEKDVLQRKAKPNMDSNSSNSYFNYTYKSDWNFVQRCRNKYWGHVSAKTNNLKIW